MASATKPQRDKPPAAPRLQPRPTAASAARAARIAINRNANPSTRSPTRISTGKTRHPASLIRVPLHKPECENKSDVKPAVIGSHPQSEADGDVEISRDPAKELGDESYNECVVLSDTAVSQTTNATFDIQRSHDNARLTEVDNDQSIAEDIEPEVPPPPSEPSTTTSPSESRAASSIRSERPSRPTTPRSRPMTPSKPHSRPTSRPVTPKNTRPKTPTNIPVPLQSPVQKNQRQIKEKEQFDCLKTEYKTKQRQFHQLKKDLDLKQQALLELFDNLRVLSERMSQEGKGGGEMVPIQDLVVFNVGDWTTDEIAQLCKDALAATDAENAIKVINTSKPIDEGALAEIDSNITKVPAHFADLCLQAFTARQELIDWIKELISGPERGEKECLERIAQYNSQGLELCENLRELKTRADGVMYAVSQISRRACQERGTLVAVGEALVREVARLRHDLEARNAIKEMREIRADTDTARMLEDTRLALEEERSNSHAMKDKLATTESQMRQTRLRIAKMDRQLREAEASIASLTGTVKTLEDQSRQREVQFEARARKLKESLKTGEMSNNHIAQQRDALQAEVQSLKEQIKQLTDKTQEETDELKAENERYRLELEKENDLRRQAEEKWLKSQAAFDELMAKVSDLETTRTSPELPTEREMDLWAELQATKDALRMTEEEMTICKRERVRFLESLTKISETENKVGIQQKLAAELLSKEEIINKMQIQIRELTKNVRLNEQKVQQYEQYVRETQAHARAAAKCNESPNGISYQDLQQEIMTLQMNLLDAVHRNEELSEELAQREQQLEQQDKTSRAQARVIKVREELINMLKNKETEQSRELSALQQDLEHRMRIVDEVNKQIAAKADEIQELFTALETKQQQIHRMEKIVLALEEQQRRAQAQRTRHEEKIAALEHELAAGIRNRERKFIFF